MKHSELIFGVIGTVMFLGWNFDRGYNMGLGISGQHQIQTFEKDIRHFHDSLLALNWQQVDSLILDDGFGMLILKDSLWTYHYDSSGSPVSQLFRKEVVISYEDFNPVKIEFARNDTSSCLYLNGVFYGCVIMSTINENMTIQKKK